MDTRTSHFCKKTLFDRLSTLIYDEAERSKMKKTYSFSIAINSIIFVLTVFATVSMIIGFHFMDNSLEYSATNWAAFKYFTVDSNVLAGIVSLIYVLYLCRKHRASSASQRHATPRWLSMLKLAATTGVTLTMMVTVFFLAPSSSRGFFALFKNSNFFFHFLIPVLCIISFIFFEPVNEVRLSHTLAGIIPMLLYSVFYITNILVHMNNGQIDTKYDLYNFLNGKVSNAWFVMPVIILITWLFSFLLWFGNKKRASRN